MGVGEDRISALPDSILHYILSFLPTKEAVGTSILSKRWRWLWTYISNLDFQYPRILRGPYPEEPQRFMRYVYNVLLLHCGTSIRKFNLTCDSCDGVSVNSWVSTVVRQQLQELSLSAYIGGGTHLLPLGVYTCESLTVLEIAICSGFKLPTSFSLPHLKRLDLSYAIFPNEHIIDQLLSSSSVLEDLTLYKCTLLNHQMFLISSPTLKQLKLSKLCIDDDGRTFDLPIKVCSPNLERFVCLTRLLLRGYNLGDMPSLGYAKIMTEEVDPVLTEEERCDSVSMLFKGLHHVKVLRISADILQNLPHEDLESELPIFHNLHHIRIARICEGTEILSLLRVTPNLQSLTFDEALLDYEEDFIPNAEDMPRCLQSSLRKVKIGRYNGHKGEFNFIDFLLKNCLALGSMVVSCGPKMPTYTREVMEEWMRILMLPKGSRSCVIGFFDSPLLSDSE